MAKVVSRRSIIYDILFDVKKGTKSVKQATKELDKVDKKTSQFSDTLKGVGAAMIAAFSVRAMAQFGKELFKTALQLEAFERRARVVFGKSLKIVEDFAKGNAKSLGLTQAGFKGAAAAIGDILVPLGLTRQKAAEVSVEMVKLGGALKQFTGDQRTASEISDVVARALTGEIEGLKSLGVVITQASKEFQGLIKQKMEEEGASLSQAKALAIYETVLLRSTDAMNSFENDTESLTRQTAELSAEWEELREELATRLTPALLSTVSALNRLFDPELSATNQLIKLKEATELFDKSLSDLAKNGFITQAGRDLIAQLEQFNISLVKAQVQTVMTKGEMELWEQSLASSQNQTKKTTETLKKLIDDLKTLQDEFKTTETNTPRFIELRDMAIPDLRAKIKGLIDGPSGLKDLKDEMIDLDEVISDAFGPDALDQLNLYAKGLTELNELTKELGDTNEFQLAPAIEGVTNTAQINARILAEINKDEAERQQILKQGLFELAAASQQLAIQGGAAAKSLALITIISAQASALAKSIPAALDAGFPGFFIALPSIIATIIATIAQAKSILSQAQTVQIVGGTATAFAEGTEYLERGESKKGKDTIPIWADEGEAIISADSNKAYPGLARAFLDKDITNWIGVNYEIPTITNNVDIPANIDYTSSFYRQWRTTKDGHIGTKHMIGLLSSIDRKLGTTPVRYV